jgi:hypothetical protein
VTGKGAPQTSPEVRESALPDLRLNLGFLALGRKSPDAMAVWLNDYKSSDQVLFRIRLQDAPKFGMDGVLGRGEHTQIQDPRTHALKEDKAAEVPVTGDEDPILPVGHLEQVRITGLRHPDFSDANDIVPQLAEIPTCRRIHVLIQQKVHTAAALR